MLPVYCTSDITRTTGTVEGTPAIMRKTCLLVSQATPHLTERKTIIQVTILTEHTFTLEAKRKIAFFRIPTSHQAANKTPMPPEHLKLTSKFPEEAEAVENQLCVKPEIKHTDLYPTPETCSNPDKLDKIERRTFD